MKLTRTRVITDHGIHGKSARPALEKDGLALIKLEGKRVTWRVYHALTGIVIGSAGDRPTQSAGRRVMAALLALPVDWARADTCTQIKDHLAAVRTALATA